MIEIMQKAPSFVNKIIQITKNQANLHEIIMGNNLDRLCKYVKSFTMHRTVKPEPISL